MPSLKTKISTMRYAETLEFYCELLGLTALEEWDEADDRGVILEFPGGHREALLEIYASAEPADLSALSLQFRVDDLGAFAMQLPPDLPFRGPVERPWGATYLYLDDPNGVQVIVYEGGW